MTDVPSSQSANNNTNSDHEWFTRPANELAWIELYRPMAEQEAGALKVWGAFSSDGVHCSATVSEFPQNGEALRHILPRVMGVSEVLPNQQQCVY